MAGQTRQVDGNSLEEIADFLKIKLSQLSHKEFNYLRSISGIKVLCIRPENIAGDGVILRGTYDNPSDAISSAVQRNAEGGRESFCAYDGNGKYIGGLN